MRAPRDRHELIGMSLSKNRLSLVVVTLINVEARFGRLSRINDA